MLYEVITELQTRYADLIDFRPEGYGVDKAWRQVIYLPEDATLDLLEQRRITSYNVCYTKLLRAG